MSDLGPRRRGLLAGLLAGADLPPDRRGIGPRLGDYVQPPPLGAAYSQILSAPGPTITPSDYQRSMAAALVAPQRSFFENVMPGTSDAVAAMDAAKSGGRFAKGLLGGA
jgi:hypothetical protein